VGLVHPGIRGGAKSKHQRKKEKFFFKMTAPTLRASSLLATLQFLEITLEIDNRYVGR
jgi:hypothetical protein